MGKADGMHRKARRTVPIAQPLEATPKTSLYSFCQLEAMRWRTVRSVSFPSQTRSCSLFSSLSSRDSQESRPLLPKGSLVRFQVTERRRSRLVGMFWVDASRNRLPALIVFAALILLVAG